MYGYVRPDKGELKVSEYERFRGVYCGLCHELKARYGPVCRFLVNYDFTFLAMLLAAEEDTKQCVRRCPYRPMRKAVCPEPRESLAAAADCTIILAYWKLKDGAADKGLFSSLGCRFICLSLRRHYKKAAGRLPDFASATEKNIAALASLEAQNSSSLDAVADTFASILSKAGSCVDDENQRRILEQMLYHLGRIVYVLDAVDDLDEDVRKNGYNPLRYRYTLVDGKLAPEDEAALRQSLQLSHNCISNAFVLLNENPYTAILSNILYYGIPSVAQSVFAGTWKKLGQMNRERSNL